MSAYVIAHVGHTTKSTEHVVWWAANRRGYTLCVGRAGRYSEAEARSICRDGTECVAIPVSGAEKLARSLPYYRTLAGTLNPLYDAAVAPVENSRKAWNALLAARLHTSPSMPKPTPMPRHKSRAIYLDGIVPARAKGGGA